MKFGKRITLYLGIKFWMKKLSPNPYWLLHSSHKWPHTLKFCSPTTKLYQQLLTLSKQKIKHLEFTGIKGQCIPFYVCVCVCVCPISRRVHLSSFGCYPTQGRQRPFIFFQLFDYSILLLAKHDELIHEKITWHTHE